MRKVIIALLCACVLGATATSSQAQQAGAQTGAQAAMPPALTAAIASGNPDAVTRAINTLAAGNPTRLAQLAQQAINAAERTLGVNPVAAANIASAATKIFNQPSVIQAAPQQSLNAVVSASRIAINPAVQKAAPAVSAAISTNVIQTATAPAVYAVSPTAALQAMSDNYNSVSSPVIANAAPNALKAVTQALANAAVDPKLAALLQQSGAVITAILTKQDLPDVNGKKIEMGGSAS